MRHTERHDVCSTDTQWVVQMSGYTWALRHLVGRGRLRILDAACGAGFGTHALAGAGLIIGVDVAAEAVVASRGRYQQPGIHYFVMDVSQLGFSDAAFDAIISQDTIEHVRNDERFVAEAHRVLRPGGLFFVFTPYRKTHSTSPENPYHLREYSPESLLRLLREHFPSVRLFGRRAGAALQDVEALLDKVRRHDPSGIRALIPRPIRHFVGSLWLRFHRRRPLRRISVEDVEYTEGPPEDSTTIVAVCTSRA